MCKDSFLSYYSNYVQNIEWFMNDIYNICFRVDLSSTYPLLRLYQTKSSMEKHILKELQMSQ